MNTTLPPSPPSDAPPPPPDYDDTPPPAAATTRIFGGVAALIGQRLGFDPLWLRMGFVVLALIDGLGLVIYGGLWLALIAGPERRSRHLQLFGGLILLVGVPLFLHGGTFHLMTGTLPLVMLLAGLAIALWQPANAKPWSPPTDLVASPRPDKAGRPPEGRPNPDTADPLPPPVPSILGPVVIGAAIVVAAGGALIDEMNGGRSHPEQWLGAAAVVCGVGLLIGAFRGRARWLILPALAFATVGLGAGQMAAMGISLGNVSGTRHIHIDERTTATALRGYVGLDEVSIFIGGPPPQQVRVDARSAAGNIFVSAREDVTVLVNTRDAESVAVGAARYDDNGSYLIGPGDTPDVIVDAWSPRGSVEVMTFGIEPDYVDDWSGVDGEIPPADFGELRYVASGLHVTTDGWFVLDRGQAVIDDEDHLVVGESWDESNGVTVIHTELGEFRLLPRGLLMTPYDGVIDLHAVRAAQTPTTTEPAAPPDPDDAVPHDTEPAPVPSPDAAPEG